MLRNLGILIAVVTVACAIDEPTTVATVDQEVDDGPTQCLPGPNLNFPNIGPLTNLKTFCDGQMAGYPCTNSPNGQVPNCWAGTLVTAQNGFGGTTPAQCLCPPNLPPPGPGCNPMSGGPVNVPGGGVQDCRKPGAIRFGIREKQAIGPKDNANSRYDGDSCIADWISYLRGPGGKGNWSIAECTLAATATCGAGEVSTWWNDRLQPFDAQDRHRIQMDISLSCNGVPDGGSPRMIGSGTPNTGGGSNSGQELCGLVNGSSYPTQAWVTANAFRLNLRGEPAGIIGAGFNTACSFCGKSPFGNILDRCSNSSIMMDYAGTFTCRNGSPTVNVTYGAVTVFPSSRFEIIATPITDTGAPTGAPASTVFAQEHLMERPYGAAGLVSWNPPAGPRPDGPVRVMIGGAIPPNPGCPAP
jgi:hypothetical protein